jgi:phosphoserine phosphatase RsbU/P
MAGEILQVDYIRSSLPGRGQGRERYGSAQNSRLRGRLSLTGDSPKAIGHGIIQDLQEFSAGHAQFDDITLICFGPVTPAGCP